jgi:hypothetical protein
MPTRGIRVKDVVEHGLSNQVPLGRVRQVSQSSRPPVTGDVAAPLYNQAQQAAAVTGGDAIANARAALQGLYNPVAPAAAPAFASPALAPLRFNTGQVGGALQAGQDFTVGAGLPAVAPIRSPRSNMAIPTSNIIGYTQLPPRGAAAADSASRAAAGLDTSLQTGSVTDTGDLDLMLRQALGTLPDPSTARAGYRGREQELWDMLNGLSVDEQSITDDAYRQVLALGGNAVGGAAAQRGAVFQAAQQLPEVMAGARKTAADARVDQARLASEIVGEQGRQELAEYQTNINRGLGVAGVMQELLGQQLELDQRDQEALGQAMQFFAGLDAQMADLGFRERFSFAQLAEQDKWQLMEDALGRLEISERGRQALQQIKQNKSKDWWDRLAVIGGVVGNVGSAVRNTLGSPTAAAPTAG